MAWGSGHLISTLDSGLLSPTLRGQGTESRTKFKKRQGTRKYSHLSPSPWGLHLPVHCVHLLCLAGPPLLLDRPDARHALCRLSVGTHQEGQLQAAWGQLLQAQIKKSQRGCRLLSVNPFGAYTPGFSLEPHPVVFAAVSPPRSAPAGGCGRSACAGAAAETLPAGCCRTWRRCPATGQCPAGT